MIKIGSDKIYLLSAYLHDATFYFKDVILNKDENNLSILLSRVYYEEPKRSKFLFFIPAIKFKRIECKLIISKVTHIEYKWRNDAFDSPKSVHTLLCLEYDNNNLITIETEYMDIEAKLLKLDEIILHDISEPTKNYPVTDLCKSLGFENVVNELKGV